MPAYLIVSDGGGSRHDVAGRAVVGRDADCDVLLSSLSASRKHACVEQTASGWMLKDLSSVNGTFVNGKRVTETLLSNGDALRFGEVKAVFEISDKKSVSGTNHLLQTLSLPPTRKARPLAVGVATLAGILLLVGATIWAKQCDHKAAAPPPAAGVAR